MIAYNSLWLRNINTRDQAQEAFHQDYLNKEEYENIKGNYPVGFFTPNLFIRIGLFILTAVILLFGFGLFSLLFLNSIVKAIGGMAIFFAFISYAALEYMVREKKHFRSGVDDALLWISACSFFGGVSYLTNAGELANCTIVFFITLYGSLRFGDKLMSLVLYISLLGIIFFACIKMGASAKQVVPFVMMAISVIVYGLVKKTMGEEIIRLYNNCLQIISIGALLSFYVACNYFVVRELSNALFDLNLAKNESIPFGWLFWIFTFVIPFFYIALGILKKDFVLIRVGLLLVAAIVITVRNYFPIASIEVIMTESGIILLVISYSLTLYLKNPRFGFTKLELAFDDTKGAIQIESLLVAETFASPSVATNGTKFGGGSFGGGGASSDF